MAEIAPQTYRFVVSTVTQNNFLFTPSNFSVKSGSTITVKDANAGTSHTFDIDCTPISIINGPGQSHQVKINIPPGTYRFFCEFHGTPTSGMHGTLTVT